MKTFLTSAIAIAIVASAGAAAAQPGPHRNDNRNDGRYEQPKDHGPARAAERRDDNRYERRAERRYKAARYQAPRGYQARQWRHGEKLPPAYRGRAYVVDYRTYRLAPPPRGYQYVRVGNDVVLSGTNTGVIASVIQQLFQ
ncbi:MAG: RcnB family protein [Phenylobacterium sp.]